MLRMAATSVKKTLTSGAPLMYCVALRCAALRCFTLCCVALSCVASRYVALCIALQCDTM
eukprot:11183839-Lingulodinium_polyedra.AAC.1